MQVLRDVLEQAEQRRIAVGHFNVVADLVLLKAVFSAAQEPREPAMVGVSEGEREFMGVRQIAALVRSLCEEFDFPIFLNADHTHSLAKAVEAAEAGFDAIVFDLSALPFEKNVRETKAAVEALKTINPSILVEGEIGDIGTGSEIHQNVPDLSQGPHDTGGGETVRRVHGRLHFGSSRGQHAWDGPEHGARRNQETVGRRKNRPH